MFRQGELALSSIQRKVDSTVFEQMAMLCKCNISVWHMQCNVELMIFVTVGMCISTVLVVSPLLSFSGNGMWLNGIFHRSSTSVYYCETQTEEQKTGQAWERGYGICTWV